MHRALLVLSLVVLGCGGAAKEPAPPPPPPPKPVTAPDAVCKHVSEISKSKFDDDDLRRCREKMEALRDEAPKTYACVAGCVDNAKGEADAEPCLKACVPAAPASPDSEGTRNIGSMEVGSKNMFQQETDTSPNGTGEGPYVHRFCPSSKQPVPAELPKAGEKVLVPASVWNDPTWTCLKFSINEPQLFQYSYENNGKDGVQAGYVAIARRRLLNGKIRTFRLEGRGDQSGDAVRVSLTERDE